MKVGSPASLSTSTKSAKTKSAKDVNPISPDGFDQSYYGKGECPPMENKRRTTLTETNMDSKFGSLTRIRTNKDLWHLPSEPQGKDCYCQLHYFQESKSKVKKNVFLCEACNVHLCIKCYKDFHRNPFVGVKYRQGQGLRFPKVG